MDLAGGWGESDPVCSAKGHEGGAEDEDMEDDTKDKAGAGQAPVNPQQTSQLVNRPSLQSAPETVYNPQQVESISAVLAKSKEEAKKKKATKKGN